MGRDFVEESAWKLRIDDYIASSFTKTWPLNVRLDTLANVASTSEGVMTDQDVVYSYLLRERAGAD